MTVCIAAISPKHNVVSYATDRMVTSSFPPIQFEHTIPKTVQINKYCVALTAGNAITSKEVLEMARQAIQGRNVTTAEVANQVAQAYQRKRLEILTTYQLSARGMSHGDFLTHGARILPDHIYADIDRAFATFSLEVDILLAGIDGSGPSIYGITNPGIAYSYNSIGFHAIGMGTMHALISLVEMYEPESDGLRLTYAVYRAKRIAEIAPGVGQRTDLGIITMDQGQMSLKEASELFTQFASRFANESSARKELTKWPESTTLISNAAEQNADAQDNVPEKKEPADAAGR